METYDAILARMKEKFQELSGFSADDASDVGIRMKVLAGEVFSLWNGLEWLKRQAFPATAIGEYLEEHAVQRGLARKEAVCSEGTLAFSRQTALEYDVLIPKGTVCATAGEESVQYVTLADALLAAGKLTVTAAAKSREGGSRTNAAAGKIVVPVSAPSGIEAVSNPSAFTGGMDRETDEELRKRLLQSYSMISNGTNAEFYRECALRHDGVYSVGVKPRANGAGTVGVYLAAKGGAPAAGVVQEVQAELDSLREINVDVEVSAATLKDYSVSIYLEPAETTTFAAAKETVKQAILDYLAGLSVGEPVYLARIGKTVLETGMVKNYQFNSSVSLDMEPAVSELAVAKTISILELEAAS